MPLLYKSKTRSKKVGFIALLTFTLCLILFILSFVFYNKISDSLDFSGMQAFGYFISIVFFTGLISLFVTGLALGNKLVKILFAIPLGLIIVFFITYLLILRPHKINGQSMSPVLKNGDFVLASVWKYKFGNPKRGDIVIFKSPVENNSEFVARIIGMPGENISIIKGKVYINNKILGEPYINDGSVTDPGTFLAAQNILIPDGEYAVMGDNRPHSLDSRGYGFVKRSDITQFVFYIYWPGSDRGIIKY